jgi:hypothetical protein
MLEQEQTAMSEDNTLENMIDYAANADYNKANAVFNHMIAQKMDGAMDQERIAVAGRIFNDVEPEELEAEEASDGEETTEIETSDEGEETAETDETSTSEEEVEVEEFPTAAI